MVYWAVYGAVSATVNSAALTILSPVIAGKTQFMSIIGVCTMVR